MSTKHNAAATKSIGWLIRVRGTVQGVGFRPTVYNLACALGITGHVLNDGEGVVIEAWASEETLNAFLVQLTTDSPPLAKIETIEKELLTKNEIPPGFEIVKSDKTEAKTGVAADAATCSACKEDVFSPFSRRYRYPFTNCTHCGPRLTIVEGIPYDRANTSMKDFTMCAECQAEYDDPRDRRFHAQPNACHACGPKAVLERMDKHALCIESFTQLDDVDAVATLLARGELVAIKGIGGFHLACDATNEDAVKNLRARKKRFGKPFALMARDLPVIERYCLVSEKERELLQSHHAPIVLLSLGKEKVAPSVAPNQTTLGFMLPYTPMHHLMMRRMDRPIVLTSGNRSDEPQCIDNEDCRARLSDIADYVLLHDRDIVNRVDDSVMRVMAGQPVFIRRARGYAPAALTLPSGFDGAPEILAMGGELKNTFCLVKDNKAIVSQHIGDLEDALTNRDYQKNLLVYQQIFQHNPRRIAIDLHPEYLSSKLGRARAQAQNLQLDAIQHHHAHIASCLADNGWALRQGEVLGVALDGLGFGTDGTFWGGEFLLADYFKFSRLGTFKPVALLGGAQAMREPWRNTYAHLMAEIGWPRYKMDFDELELTAFFEGKALATFNSMLANNINSPLSSSCGRLFDAVAAAMGICRERVSYEGQAAIEMEAAIDFKTLYEESDTLAYPFAIPRLQGSDLPYIEPIAMWQAVLGDLILATDRGIMAARFHKGLAKAIVHMVEKLATRDDERWIDTVALSGGVFQNKVLLELVKERLTAAGFNVLTHKNVPANDGGLSLGQAAISAALHIS